MPPAVGSFGAMVDISVELWVVDLQAGQRMRHAEILAQRQHPVEEGRKARLQAEIGGEPLDLVLDGLAVEDQHIGHEHRVGQAVMGVVERADRMRQRVDRAEPLLEGGGAHGGRRHHVGARFEIGAVRDRRAAGTPSPAACPRPRCRRPSGDRTGAQ